MKPPAVARSSCARGDHCSRTRIALLPELVWRGGNVVDEDFTLVWLLSFSEIPLCEYFISDSIMGHGLPVKINHLEHYRGSQSLQAEQDRVT